MSAFPSSVPAGGIGEPSVTQPTAQDHPRRHSGSLDQGAWDDGSPIPPDAERLAESELDLLANPPRFAWDDEPDFIKLETKGVTQQIDIYSAAQIHAASILAKLNEARRDDLTEGFADCHTWTTVQECNNCHRVRRFQNRCDLFYCPMCQPRLARRRVESIQWWAKLVSQPKHVVLTVRNTQAFTKDYVKWFKKCWGRLRRSVLAYNWRGGCYSLEVTNEGQGWHLHLHALIDADWIDSRILAQRWAKIVGQAFAIVKVKDARNADYLAEVVKYAVKGSQLASWPADEIATFIDALKGTRTFGVFGTLYKHRHEFKQWFAATVNVRGVCECGCNKFRYFDEQAWEAKEIEREINAPRPPPVPSPEPQLHFLP